LKWLAREFRETLRERRLCRGFISDDLPDEHRTCIFRVVQEAVRNAARIPERDKSESIFDSGPRDLRLSPGRWSSFDPGQEKGWA